MDIEKLHEYGITAAYNTVDHTVEITLWHTKCGAWINTQSDKVHGTPFTDFIYDHERSAHGLVERN